MTGTASQAVVERVRRAGIARSRDLEAEGISRAQLARLTAGGVLVRVGRGLYALPGDGRSAQQTVAVVAARIPHGVICLESALRIHGLTTAAPRRVWVAIQPKDWKPQVRDLPIEIVRFSGEAFTAGVEHHEIDRVRVPVYSPAKTVADCFKYRNKIGLDPAIEALRDCWEQRRCTADELMRFARIDRVANVMRPYMESLP
ncbi:MAG: AbiEi antitoxin N-terminal domain-containing protein [Candidatus Omnitrophota bacterium]|nr:AbiEi antitoxin N-terminal domain-containing protein [Candidatus Omnitrophota bacterium]